VAFTADDKQLFQSLRQLKGYRPERFLRKIGRAENLTCFKTLTNIGQQKELQAVDNRATIS